MTKWDDEADLVVIGFGSAGGAAAVAAADHGAEVIVLEKQSQARHTPSSKMGGSVLMVTTDAKQAAKYFDRCAAGAIPPAVTAAWAKGAVDILPWIKSVTNVDYTKSIGAEHPEFEGSEAVWSYQAVGQYSDPATDVPGAGRGLLAAFEVAIAERPKIKVEWETPADRLIQDETGRVIGVEVSGKGGKRRIHARKGVVLTCGGYEYNNQMKVDFLKADPIYFYGNPGNTGDGVRMAQAVGADLWHMNQMIGRGVAHFDLEDGSELNSLVSLGGVMAMNAPTTVGYVITDRDGNRFADEHMQAVQRHDFYYLMLGYDPNTNAYPRNPSFWFWDEKRMRLGPPVATQVGAINYGYYDWSEGSKDELAKGWFFKGDTIEEVAAAAGLADPAGAARSIAEYNEICRTGVDPFGRPAESLVPIEEGPFYCLPLYPGGSNTTGGPRRNEHAQIIDVYGDPIPGLYEAGELGEPVGLLYPCNGGNISDCLTFGRIAAEHAVGVTR